MMWAIWRKRMEVSAPERFSRQMEPIMRVADILRIKVYREDSDIARDGAFTLRAAAR